MKRGRASSRRGWVASARWGEPEAVLELMAAIYDWTAPEADWLTRILDAAAPSFDVGLGLVGMTYDLRDEHLAVRSVVTRGGDVSPEFVRQAAIHQGGPAIGRLMGAHPCGYASEALGGEAHRLKDILPLPVRDVFRLTAANPTGQHCMISANTDARRKLSAKELAVWRKVTRHLAAGYRLRRSLSDESSRRAPEAIFTPTGDTEHAEPEVASARHQLRRAVLDFEEARRSLDSGPDLALERWRPLVAARWSLVEEFQHGSKRYVVARRNEAITARWKTLSVRERQALAFLAMGYSNKLIAYDLGIAPSTVSVLLCRASRKLGVSSRAELARVAGQLLGSGS